MNLLRWLRVWVRPADPPPEGYDARPLKDRVAVFFGFRGRF